MTHQGVYGRLIALALVLLAHGCGGGVPPLDPTATREQRLSHAMEEGTSTPRLYFTSTSTPIPTPTPTLTPSPTRTPRPSPTLTLTPTSSSPFRSVEPPPGAVRHLWIGPEGRSWLTTDAGIFVRADGAWEPRYEGVAVGILGVDGAGRIWALLADEREIAAYHGPAWTTYGPDQGWAPPPAGDYHQPGWGDALVTDGQGRVWLATGGNDLRRFDPQTQTWTVLTATDVGFDPPEEESYQGHFLTDVALDATGDVWVANCIGQGEGLLGQGVRRFDGEIWHGAAETAGECVYDVEVDDAGRLWIGGTNGLIRHDPQTGAWSWTPLPVYADSRREIVRSIELDPTGRCWVEFIACGGASCDLSVIYVLPGGEWQPAYAPPPGDWMGPAQGLAFAPDGSTWLGAPDLIYHFVNDSRVDLELPTGLCAYNWQMEVDGEGRLWLAQQPVGSHCASGLWILETTE